MLNLVQLQERLKDVPMQALMQYANGANPQVPPFLALGELNRRKKMQEGAAADQAAEMEGAPTIKEQIEQSTGLMALQGARQKQAAQQQAGIQAAMPMAAPNTTTSEPAQMAGGGFIDDVVVPRDYQAGGVAGLDPVALKKLALLRAMKNQPRKAGLPGIPVNMFRRADYANGGIVAFAGPEGSVVPEPSAADVINKAVGEATTPTTPQEVLAEILRRRKERQSLEERMKQAGIMEPPGPTEELSALEAQQQRRREADTLARRVMSLDPMRIGRSMAEYLGKEEAAETDIETKKAKAKDLHASAKFNAAKGNIKDAIADEREADKTDKEIATAMADVGYKGALAEQAFAGKTTDWKRRYDSYLPSVMQSLKKSDPNDPQVMAATARMVDESIGRAGQKVDILETQAGTAARKEATQDYEVAAKLVNPTIERGGSRYKEYRKIQREQGQVAADAFRENLIQEEVQRMRAGPRPASAPAPAPAPAPASKTLPTGLPPGSKQIGTSGGKPVYQLPNGQKVVAQ